LPGARPVRETVLSQGAKAASSRPHSNCARVGSLEASLKVSVVAVWSAPSPGPTAESNEVSGAMVSTGLCAPSETGVVGVNPAFRMPGQETTTRSIRHLKVAPATAIETVKLGVASLVNAGA
jgi:hypothetical protein